MRLFSGYHRKDRYNPVASGTKFKDKKRIIILEDAYITVSYWSHSFWPWLAVFPMGNQLCCMAVWYHPPILLPCHAHFFWALEWARRVLCLALGSSLSLSVFFFFFPLEGTRNAFHLPLVMLWWQIIRNFNQSCFVSMTLISKRDGI